MTLDNSFGKLTMMTITIIITIITILKASKQLQRPQSQLQVYQLPHARPLCSLRQQLVKIVNVVFKWSLSMFWNYCDISSSSAYLCTYVEQGLFEHLKSLAHLHSANHPGNWHPFSNLSYNNGEGQSVMPMIKAMMVMPMKIINDRPHFLW